MGKPGRPPGKSYTREIRVPVTDDMYGWLSRMSEIMGVSIAEAARMVMGVGMDGTVKGSGTGDGNG